MLYGMRLKRKKNSRVGIVFYDVCYFI